MSMNYHYMLRVAPYKSSLSVALFTDASHITLVINKLILLVAILQQIIPILS